VPAKSSSQSSEPPSIGSRTEIGVGTIAMALAAFSMALFVYFTT
jgi:hypothetical protein